MPANVRRIGHVYTREHNAFNRTPLAVLNIARDSMAAIGFSPATRVFEAAGAGACLITDAWEGIELFLKPDEEVLVARDGAGRGPSSRGADARARRRPSARRACDRDPGGAHLCRARRAGRCHPEGRGGPSRGGAPHDRASRLSMVVLGPEPVLVAGATGMRPPIARCCGPSRARSRCPVPGAGRAVVCARTAISSSRISAASRCIGPRSAGALPGRRSRAADAVDGRLLRAGGRRGRALGAIHRAGRHGVLRHRYAGDAREAGARRLRVSAAGADPRLRRLFLVHGRTDAGEAEAALRLARRRARSTARSIPTPIRRRTRRRS